MSEAERRAAVLRVLTWPPLRLAVPVLIASAALLILHSYSRDIRPADIAADLRAYGWPQLGLSFLAMCASYLALSFYDVILLRGVSQTRLPRAVPMLTGVSAMAISNLLGFSWLTGAAVRYRVYATFGVDIAAVARLIATSWGAFFVGLFTILGVLFIFHPKGLSAVLQVRGSFETVLGLAILVGIAVLMWWLRRGPRRIGIGAVTLDVPGAKLLSLLALIAIVDLVATSLTLYVLLPPDLAVNFVFFFVVFVVSVGIGIVSHAPGGLGVFEAAVITGLGVSGRIDVLAALVVYRLIYTLLPFAIAVIGLAIAWTLSNRAAASQGLVRIHRIVAPIVPILAAGLTLLSGATLIVSGNLPADPGRLGFLRGLLPLPLVETSHLLASVTGLMLMVMARGLYQRMWRAWVLAVAMLGLGLVLSLTRAFDIETALSLAASLAVLVTFRSAFYRLHSGSVMALSWRWILGLVTLVATLSWIGFFSFRDVTYSSDLWWKFAWRGDASRFLRALTAALVVLAAIILNTLLSKQVTRLRRQPIPKAVRPLVRAAPDTRAWLALTGDKRFLVAEDARAYLAYADTGATLVCQNDPVGAPDACAALIWRLREMADRMGRKCAFYSVSERFLPTYLDLGLNVLKIGEVARVDLASFNLDGSRRKDLRQAKARAARDGYRFEVLSGADLGPAVANLQAVSDAWLAHKGTSEKAFTLGRFDPDYLANFDIALLRHTETGHITAFANLMAGGDRSELSLDLMRYDPAGLGVAMDALFAEMLLWGKATGFARFSLGAAPLSGLDNRRLASRWQRFGSFLYTHGELFYHFEGLRSFKQKFDPAWSPNYLATTGRLDAARVLYEVSVLVSGRSRDERGKASCSVSLPIIPPTDGRPLASLLGR